MDVGEAIRSVLQTIQDIKDLKPEQEACLTNFLEGKDVFGLLPTGFGKSLIYQLAPLVAKTLCKPNANANPIVIVVSPLLALIEDQIKEAGILGVTAGQLGVSDDQDIINGKFSIVFGSPESWILTYIYLAHSIRHRQAAAISRSKRKQPPPGSKRISTARVQTLYEM